MPNNDATECQCEACRFSRRAESVGRNIIRSWPDVKVTGTDPEPPKTMLVIDETASPNPDYFADAAKWGKRTIVMGSPWPGKGSEFYQVGVDLPFPQEDDGDTPIIVGGE